jgi:hypothetical protein
MNLRSIPSNLEFETEMSSLIDVQTVVIVYSLQVLCPSFLGR